MRAAIGFAVREPREAWLVLRMAGSVAVLSTLVKVLPLPKALSLLSARQGVTRQGEVKLSEERLAQLLDHLLSLNALCFTPTCWKRAPVLRRYLAKGGRQTRIVFGLRKGESDLLAGHAWLEADGRPLFEAEPPAYVVTYSFPSQPDAAKN